MGSSYPGGVTEPRGPWHYDGEIDLGFGGALRMAATVVTNDPTFGWLAYGGTLTDGGATLAINPRDGLRRRRARVGIEQQRTPLDRFPHRGVERQFADEFEPEFDALPAVVQDEIRAHSLIIAQLGPHIGRPHVDTLKGSKYANMKELRFSWNGQVWRVAFAFDPQRQAILLVGGDKGGAGQRRFYKRLLTVADARYDDHLATLSQSTKESKNGKKTR